MKKITTYLLTSLSIILISANVSAQDVVIDQSDLTGFGIISSQGNDGIGIYAADDFILTEDTVINEITLFGYSSTFDPYELDRLNLYIYNDNAGLPDGNPTIAGSGVVELSGITEDFYTIDQAPGEDFFVNFTIDIEGANGGELSLPAGTYWLVPFPSFNETFNYSAEFRWDWGEAFTNSGTDPVFIDPTGFDTTTFPSTEWTTINTIFNSSDYNAFAFTIVNDEALNVSDAILTDDVISLYPNPSRDILNIKLNRNFESEVTIQVINTIGQTVLQNIIGDNNVVNSFSVDGLSNGVYFAKISTEKSSVVLKFIKE